MQFDQFTLGQLFTEAHSFHKFSDQEVNEDIIRQLYDLMKWGPSSMNCQPARLVFIQSPEQKKRLLPAMIDSNIEKTKKAPLTVIVAYDTHFYKQLPSQFPAYDAAPMFEADPELAHTTAFRNSSLQGAYLMMAARALGLDCGPLSGFDEDKVNAEFFPEREIKVNFIVNIGYGLLEGYHPRGPRLDFDEVVTLL